MRNGNSSEDPVRGKKKAQIADTHFQEIAKDIYERNQKVANPYEHEDAEQYNWSFDIELSAEKKDLIKKTKLLIALITDKTPPKNYLERRTTKLRNENTGHATFDMESAIKEYDEFAIEGILD